jgi:Tol biopolymer transport system component
VEQSVKSSSVLVTFASVAALLIARQAFGQDHGFTERVSVSTSGTEANGASISVSLSGDGKLAAFESNAKNLVTGDKNSSYDIFVRDRVAGTTELVSVDSAGKQHTGSSLGARITADGRFVAFKSYADGLVAGDTNGQIDVYLRDRTTMTTEIESVDSNGNFSNGRSQGAVISRDGTCVAFTSDATNLVAGDGNGVSDVFLRDRVGGTTERISVDSAGVEGNGSSATAEHVSQGLSADGLLVVFTSNAMNLVASDTNGFMDVFVRDRTTGTTERVSVDSAGGEANGTSEDPAISLDGRCVLFRSNATNLVANDTNQANDLFLHDRTTGTTVRVSVDSTGAEADHHSFIAQFTAEGTRVVFSSNADNLAPGDVNGAEDVFVRDLALGTTELFEIDWIQGLGEGGTWPNSISDDGRIVGFYSSKSTFVPGDTNLLDDAFVHERHLATWSNYGAGFPGTNGIPDLTASAAPVLGTSIQVALANSLGTPTVGLLFVGFAQADVATPRGGHLLVDPAFILPISFSIGGNTFDFDVPNDPSLFDLHLDLQALEADPGAAKGISFSAGLELVLGY